VTVRAGCNNRRVASRQQRRQGVVYGPARPSTPGSGFGAFLGRILGLSVLVMAVALLGVGVFTFLGGGAASPTPLPTAIARSSPSPSSSEPPTAAPTSSTIAPTQPPLSASPSGSTGPGVTPSPPLIQVGPGFVTFGTRADNELRILDPRTSFASSERITWSAYMIDTVNTAEVRVLVTKSDPGAPGGERLITDEAVTPASTSAQIFIRRIRPPRFLDGPGFYTVRYVRGDRLLAEGYFVVTD